MSLSIDAGMTIYIAAGIVGQAGNVYTAPYPAQASELLFETPCKKAWPITILTQTEFNRYAEKGRRITGFNPECLARLDVLYHERLWVTLHEVAI